jgi:hypothetical protein
MLVLVTSLSLVAGAEVRHVPGVYTTIQAAIDAAVDGDVVRVADGTYTGAGNRDIDFRGKALTVCSENGPTNCIIDGGGSEAEPHLVFFFHSAEGRDSVLDGLTIINGFHEEAGAIYCTYVSIRDPRGSSPTITRCVIRNNRGNACGAIRCNSLCEPMISDCIIAENIGMYVGGISFADECSPVISGCIVRGNFGGYNGGIRTGGAHCHGTISNSVVSGNRSDFGLEAAGIEWWAYGGSLTLTNCTIVNNAGGPGVLIGGGGNPTGTITNCIVWGNTGSEWSSGQLYFWEMTPAITHSAIEDGWPGEGNIDSDPLFVDAEDDDLRLLGGSPCLDAGDNSALPDWMTTDVAGQPRIANEIVDIGAYEGPNQGLAVLPRALVLAEGQTACFTVRLGMDPGGSVMVEVAVTSGDPDITVASRAVLAFDSSNYARPQTVTLVAAEDNDFENGSAVVTVAASGFPIVTIQVAERDNDHILYVDAGARGAGAGTSWRNALVSLQDALATARRYDHIREIRIAQGVYRPDRGTQRTPGDRNASFELINGVALRGGYAGLSGPDPDERDSVLYETILSGDLNGNDTGTWYDRSRRENSLHVVTAYGDEVACLEAVLDGVTITGGNADGEGWYDGVGAGLFCEHAGGLVIRNCMFRGNHAGSAGGGLCDYASSGWELAGCVFVRNHCGGHGGAMSLNQGSAPTRISHCLVYDNEAEWAGGAYFGDAYGQMVNCTISNNRARDQWGGVMVSGESMRFRNSIFWGNTCDNSNVEWAQIGRNDGYAAFDYCCVQGWTGRFAGVGTIDDDPLFVDAGNDWPLKSQAGRWDADAQAWVQDEATSPCIDAGDPMSAIMHEPFPNGGIVNMGAHGGTAEASKSWFGGPVCETIVAGDINGDCAVDLADLSIMALHWLELHSPAAAP